MHELHGSRVQAAPLRMWTIYHSPRDYPGMAVLRVYDVTPDRTEPAGLCVVGDSIDEVRAHVPAGLVRLDRNASDEPAIVETWM